MIETVKHFIDNTGFKCVFGTSKIKENNNNKKKGNKLLVIRNEQ
jgi:hypothetical protein